MLPLLREKLWRPLPGIGLCVAISVLAIGIQHLEERWMGHAWLEAVVVSILLGVLVRSFWEPGKIWRKGIKICAKTMLEVAIVLLGAGLSLATLASVGVTLLLGILIVFTMAVVAGYLICRWLGLAPRLAMLVACGNGICGNAAIASVAPVIGANEEEVATSIAFTAVLGVIVVLALPLLVPMLGMTPVGYGVTAGLTVYSVSQMLAATAPVALVSVQTGTLVKLVRVLLLGPLLVVLALVFKAHREGEVRLRMSHVVPWFIIGFLLMVVARTEGWIPEAWLAQMSVVASLLTVLAMAALGLGVDVRRVQAAGPVVMLATVLGVVFLLGISLVLVRMLGL